MWGCCRLNVGGSGGPNLTAHGSDIFGTDCKLPIGPIRGIPTSDSVWKERMNSKMEEAAPYSAVVCTSALCTPYRKIAPDFQ